MWPKYHLLLDKSQQADDREDIECQTTTTGPQLVRARMHQFLNMGHTFHNFSTARVASVAISCTLLLVVFLMGFRMARVEDEDIAIWPQPTTEPSSHSRSDSIAKVSMLWGDVAEESVYQRAMSSQQKHADIHGYPMHVLSEKFGHHFWDKIYWMMEVLVNELDKSAEERAAWLLWFDADTIILNPSLKLETFLPPEDIPDIHFVCTKDWNGLNSGVFLFRVSQSTALYMAEVTALPVWHPDIYLPSNAPDQRAMETKFNETAYRNNVVYMPRHWFNGYQDDVQEGDLLVHFAGVEERIQAMHDWLEKIDGEEGEEWNRPLEAATMEAEVEKFWGYVRELRWLALDMHGIYYDRRDNLSADARDAISWFHDTTYYATDDLPKVQDALERLRNALEEDSIEPPASLVKTSEQLGRLG